MTRLITDGILTLRHVFYHFGFTVPRKQHRYSGLRSATLALQHEMLEIRRVPSSISITTQPVNRVVNLGGGATFGVTVNGIAPVTYQWQKDGVNLPSATSQTLTIDRVSPANIGNYTVVVADEIGSVTSNAAGLTIPGIDKSIWQGLLAYYPFSGNAKDGSAYGNHGINSGATLSPDRFGNADNAFVFDGEDFIEVPDNEAFKSESFTISLWFSADKFPGTTPETVAEFLISKGQNNFELHLGAPGGSGSTGIRFLPRFVEHGIVNHWDTTASTYEINRWHHITVVWDPPLNSVRCFVDGREEPLIGPSSTPTSFDNAIPARIGLRQDGTLGFYGAIDDVRIYNRALSTVDIERLWLNETAFQINDAPVVGAFDTTVSYIENGTPVALDANATVVDVDSANFAGGKLTMSIVANGQSSDRLGIRHVGNLAGQIGVSGTTVSYGGVAIGTFTGTTSVVVTLNADATPAAVQALLRTVTFSSLSENPSILDRAVRVTLTDGDGGASASPMKTVKVTAVNDAPVVGAFDTTVTYRENGVPLAIDNNATIIDVDSANFAGGKLTMSIVANGQSSDRIGIKHVGNLAGQIGVSGTAVSYGGVAIGTFAGTTSLVVTLNDKATPLAVQALLRSITFSSVSENPSVLDRTIKVTLTDGDGGTSNLPTKLVKVVAVNDAPVIGAFDITMAYVENAVPLVIDNNATVVDVDSANFAGGKLTVAVSANGQTTDRIGIRNIGNLAGQIGVGGTTVSYGGVAIGTFTGTTSLVVTLNDNATPLAVQALLRSITFMSLSESPSVLDRTIKVTLTDGDGGTSNLPTKLVKVVAVNDAPVIGAFDTTMAYVENAVPLVIDNNATVVDVDSPNLAGGKLTVAASANGQTTDRIGIKHVGNLAGQIGVSGTTVSYGGLAIGTFAGTTSLVVTLNDKATPLAVQALLRSITFASLSENPSILDRTVKVTLTDGDGGTSNLPTKTVKVVAVNDAPVIGAFDTAVTYIAKGTPVVLDTNATVTDVDSVNLNSGVLTVGVITGGQVTDRIDIRHQGTGAGQIGVSGLNVTYGGTIIGNFSGTTSLKVIFNAAATPTAVQALLRNITFRSTSATPSTTSRTIKVTLTDGDGGTSNQPVKTVTVSVVSPAAPRSQKSSLSFNDLDLSFEMGLVESDLLTVG